MREKRTVKVQHAVVVLVSILHQLVDLLLCDWLSGAADDERELLSVDVAVGVPAGHTGNGVNKNHTAPQTCTKKQNKQRVSAVHVLVEHTEALCQLFLALAGLVLLEQPHHHDQELLEVDGSAT